MTGQPDQISMLLGEMKAQLKDSAEDRRELKAAVSDIAASLNKLVIATQVIPELTKTVARHERLHQRGYGIVAAIAAIVSIFGSGVVDWLHNHFK